MEPEGLETAPEPVVDGEAQRDERAVLPIRGERAACLGVGEKLADVREVPDPEIVDDRVRVVEVEAVVEVIRVGEHQRAGEQQSSD